MTQTTKIIDISLATRIKLARTAKNMTQKTLADISDIDPGQLSKYENGLTPTPENLEKIQKALGVNLNDPRFIQATHNFLAIAA